MRDTRRSLLQCLEDPVAMVIAALNEWVWSLKCLAFWGKTVPLYGVGM